MHNQFCREPGAGKPHAGICAGVRPVRGVSTHQELNKIEAVVDYKTGQYSRRYKLTAKQKAILSCLALSENDVDEFAKSITSSYKS